MLGLRQGVKGSVSNSYFRLWFVGIDGCCKRRHRVSWWSGARASLAISGANVGLFREIASGDRKSASAFLPPLRGRQPFAIA